MLILKAEVLVLEDDEVIRNMYIDSIEEMGIKVHRCDNISKALALFKENKNILLGLIDFHTPGFITEFKNADDKGELAIAFSKREYFDFYFVTGSAELTSEKAQGFGAKDLLAKPFKLHQLQELVEHEINVKSLLLK